MWIYPKCIESTYYFGSRNDTGFNIKIISHIIWYLGSKVFEVLGENDESIH